MDGLLSEVSTIKKINKAPLIEAVDNKKNDARAWNNLEDAISILRDQPDLEELRAIIQFVQSSPHLIEALRKPAAQTTVFLTALVNDVLPNFWSQLVEDDELLSSSIDLLHNLPAINALLSRLQTLAQEGSARKNTSEAGFLAANVASIIDILQRLLQEDTIKLLWLDLEKNAPPFQPSLLKTELAQTIASGKIPSVVAKAQDVFSGSHGEQDPSWLSDGKQYTIWVARGLARLAIKLHESEQCWDRACGQFMAKGMKIGYSGAYDFNNDEAGHADIPRDQFVNTFMYELTASKNTSRVSIDEVLSSLRLHDQKQFFVTVLRLVDKASIDTIGGVDEQLAHVSALTALIQQLTRSEDSLVAYLQDILVRPESIDWIPSSEFRHAAITALARDRTILESILERSLERFADNLFVVHSPVLYQESLTQVILISAGVLHRQQPMRLRTHAKSVRYMNSISLHLKSASERIRWLGMVVGSAISSLVDPADQQLKFDDESLNLEEARKLLALVSVSIFPAKDVNLHSFFSSTQRRVASVPAPKQILPKRPSKKPQPDNDGLSIITTTSKIVEITDDDDLTVYAKPDSDPENEDDDPTLVNRDKPKPPVYIRELLIGLRETEDYDKHRIAFATATSLIRRKSGFGREVTDHIQELASILMNLNNSFDFEDFNQLREEALIAVLIAAPVAVAQYYAKSAFEGDLSVQQRTALLAAIGLGARELAAFKDDERVQVPSFPSKQLPAHLDKIYGEQSTALSRVAVRIQRSVAEPLALKAADELTGPNALKVRTFSSRIAKEKTRRKPAANELAKIVGEGFFFPLTGRWWLHARPSSSTSRSSPFASPMLLPIYLRTLAIILHAAGSWALALPQMTSEFWSILLAIRGPALGAREYPVLEALLFGLLIMLEVNNENAESIAREKSHELLETQEWCKTVLSEIAGGDQQSDRARSLAAGVIMRCQEVIERWQRLMVGSMIDL